MIYNIIRWYHTNMLVYVHMHRMFYNVHTHIHRYLYWIDSLKALAGFYRDCNDQVHCCVLSVHSVVIVTYIQL